MENQIDRSLSDANKRVDDKKPESKEIKLNKKVDESSQPKCFCSENLENNKKREEICKKVCHQLPAKYESNGKHYCILHYPKNGKSKEFQNAIDSLRQKGICDFSAIWFPDLINFEDWKTYFERLRRDPKNKEISDLKIDFSECVFSNDLYFADLSLNIPVSFQSAKFMKDADFRYTKFMDVDFSFSEFNSRVSFDDVVFNKTADFWGTRFKDQSEIFFRLTEFKKYADFRNASFYGSIAFENVNFPEQSAGFDFQYVRHGEAERTSFRSIKLRPSWFVDADAHKIVFEDVTWEISSAERELEIFKECISKDEKNISKEINNLRREVSNPKDEKEKAAFTKRIERLIVHKRHLEDRKERACYQLLSIAYRQIAANTEANGDYEYASKFRKLAFDTEWLNKKKYSKDWWNDFREILKKKNLRPETRKKLSEHLRQHNSHFLYRLYRWSSSYGESWSWALFVLFGIIMISAVFYTTPICSFKDDSSSENLVRISAVSQNLPQGTTEIKIIKDEKAKHLNFGEAVIYSLKVGTLQNRKLEPESPAAVAVVMLETVFVPVQLALLALAIRRKFMR